MLVTVLEVIDGSVDLVVDRAELAGGLQRGALARRRSGRSGFPSREKLDLLHAAAGAGQFREAAMLLLLRLILHALELLSLSVVNHQVFIAARSCSRSAPDLLRTPSLHWRDHFFRS